MEALLKLLVKLFSKGNCNDHRDIDISSVAFSITGKTFQLYVGVEGDIVGVGANGQTVNRHFIVGYHPVYFKSISTTASGTTATDLAALFD